MASFQEWILITNQLILWYKNRPKTSINFKTNTAVIFFLTMSFKWLVSLLISFPFLSFLFADLVFTYSLRQAHHVCVRTLPLQLVGIKQSRPHGVTTSTRCFLNHLWKQEEQRTKRCQFLNPTIFCPTFIFVRMVLFFFLSLFLLRLGKQ